MLAECLSSSPSCEFRSSILLVLQPSVRIRHCKFGRMRKSFSGAVGTALNDLPLPDHVRTSKLNLNLETAPVGKRPGTKRLDLVCGVPQLQESSVLMLNRPLAQVPAAGCRGWAPDWTLAQKPRSHQEVFRCNYHRKVQLCAPSGKV